MIDNIQFQQVQQATSDVVASLRETSQAFADGVVTMQNHHLRFAQHTFLSWMELLTYQTESIQQVQQQWGPQIQQRQGTFQKLMPPSMQISMDFFLAPLVGRGFHDRGAARTRAGPVSRQSPEAAVRGNESLDAEKEGFLRGLGLESRLSSW